MYRAARPREPFRVDLHHDGTPGEVSGGWRHEGRRRAAWSAPGRPEVPKNRDLALANDRKDQWSMGLIPDHGHLMHRNAEFVRSDFSVFAHIHPAGSVPMASLMIAERFTVADGPRVPCTSRRSLILLRLSSTGRLSNIRAGESEWPNRDGRVRRACWGLIGCQLPPSAKAGDEVGPEGSLWIACRIPPYEHDRLACQPATKTVIL